jgi:hypothetical protein
MAYQFIRQEPCYDHILFVLALDRDKMKERILIGTEQQIRFRLDGNKDNDVIYDITRPLGRSDCRQSPGIAGIFYCIHRFSGIMILSERRCFL